MRDYGTFEEYEHAMDEILDIKADAINNPARYGWYMPSLTIVEGHMEHIQHDRRGLEDDDGGFDAAIYAGMYGYQDSPDY